MNKKEPLLFSLSNGEILRVKDNRPDSEYIHITIFHEEEWINNNSVLIPAKNTYLYLNRRDRDILRQILEEPSNGKDQADSRA